MTRLHLVNGFLGSGKTTAIVAAVRQHLARGERVGIVTNDQGRYLVDTAFVRAEHIPVVQVAGGCFCCAYDQLLDVLTELASERPDVIYAESVGSCADLLATVVRPLAERPDLGTTPHSLSVFADSRLLLRMLQGQPLPFSDDVLYIMDRQIEEAGVLILNKIDLLDEASLEALRDLAAERLPGRPLVAQNSLQAEHIARWVSLIEDGTALPPEILVPVDYCRYATGEQQLTWADLSLVGAPEGDGRAAVIAVIEALLAVLQRNQVPVGHLKSYVRAATGEAKVSWPTLGDARWLDELPPLEGEIELLVNARLQAERSAVGTWIDQALVDAQRQSGVTWQVRAREVFTPSAPRSPQQR